MLHNSVDSVIKRQDAYDAENQSRTLQAEAKLDQTVQSLIRWLDDLDLVRSRLLGEDQAAWKKLMEQWSRQILGFLEKTDVHELKLLGTSFDPRLAESIGTLSKAEAKEKFAVAALGDIPYQIVEISKRGFVWKNGLLLRKAQVITLEKENTNVDS